MNTIITYLKVIIEIYLFYYNFSVLLIGSNISVLR